MIEIITEEVAMPSYLERRFQKENKNRKWIIRDTQDGSERYKGSYENVVLACHSLNKKYYRDKYL